MDNLAAGNSPLDKAVSLVVAFRKQGNNILAGKITIWGNFKHFLSQSVHIILS
jgi:hypothetical protein